MDFKICGRMRVRLDGQWRSDWQPTKIRNMLGVLLLRPGKTIPVEAVVDWLWGRDGDPVRHSKTLHGYVTKLRRVLETVDPPTTVERVNAGYRVDIAPERVDYHKAHALLTEAQRAARHGDHERVCDLLPEALALVEEPPLADLDSDLAEQFRRTVHMSLVLPAHYTLMTSQLELGMPERVVATLDDLQPQHELNVSLAKLRIEALRSSGRDYEATEYFFHSRRTLQNNDRPEEADELLAHHNRHRPAVVAAPGPADSQTPRKLPHDLHDFSGRDDLLAELDKQIADGRSGITVVTGTAGIGKTTLAVHWAYRVRDQFSDGYFYLDLHGFSRRPRLESTDLVRALLQAFGISPDALGDTQAQWARAAALLGDRRMLFVLDNVVNVDQIAALLDSAPDSVVLVTSRWHLDRLALHHGAKEIHVPTLEPRTSAQWLREAVGAGSERESAAFTELVALCSGMPLALRIVGRYANDRPAVSLAEIARYLREEHRILNVGEDADDAQSSIRASFMLSYRALAPSSRRLFRLLGLHPLAEIVRGAAAALTGCPHAEVRAHLDVLVHSHLIQEKTGHYEFHDLLHEFAAERATIDEPSEKREHALKRLLDWYFFTANNAERQLFPHRPGVPMLSADDDVTPVEFADDQEALAWIMRERYALVAAVHAASTQDYHHHAWRLANAINEPLKRHGFYHEALRSLEFGRVSARAVGDREGECLCLNNLGYICLYAGDDDAAYEYFAWTYRICQEIQQFHGTAVALHNLACHRMRTHDLRGAERLFNEAIEFQRFHDLDHARAGTLRRYGQLRRKQGKLSEANVLYHQALALHEEVGNLHGTGETLTDLSQLHLDRGEHQAAIDFAHKALACHDRSHDMVSLAGICCVLATAYSGRADYDDAIECARKSVRICWYTGDTETEAEALTLLATSLVSVGQLDAAVEGLSRAYELFYSRGDDRATALRDRLTELDASHATGA